MFERVAGWLDRFCVPVSLDLTGHVYTVDHGRGFLRVANFLDWAIIYNLWWFRPACRAITALAPNILRPGPVSPREPAANAVRGGFINISSISLVQ